MSRPAVFLPDYFRKRLRQRSQKATPVRLAVLQLLARTRKPLQVDVIVKRLGGRQFDQATIYRTLHRLEQHGFVRQIDFHHGRAYFELADLREHHHAICMRCDRVEDIHDCCAQNAEKIALRQSGFASIAQHSLEFFGICKRCAAKRE